jgi:hemerythrin-like domain-containing protein
MRTIGSLEGLRHEHRELLPHVDGLKLAGDAVGLPSARDAFEFVDDAWRFVSEHLLVHAGAEERFLYPAFTRALDSPDAAAILSLDHDAIRQMATELRTLRRQLADHDTIGRELANDLRRVLYGLHAMVRAHFEKEEAVVLPVLEARLSAAEATEVVRRMQQHAVHHAGQAV